MGFSRSSSELQEQQQTKPSSRVVFVDDDLKHMFSNLDTDGDGKVSPEELRLAMQRLGQPPASDQELMMMVNEIDTNGDGLIDLVEFLEFCMINDESTVHEDLAQAFSFFDLDGNGEITPEELLKALEKFGKQASAEDCKRMIDKFDRNADGLLSFEEFMEMMMVG